MEIIIVLLAVILMLVIADDLRVRERRTDDKVKLSKKFIESQTEIYNKFYYIHEELAEIRELLKPEFRIHTRRLQENIRIQLEDCKGRKLEDE